MEVHGHSMPTNTASNGVFPNGVDLISNGRGERRKAIGFYQSVKSQGRNSVRYLVGHNNVCTPSWEGQW